MLLAIDIGNTNISFGIFKDKTLLKKFDIPTKTYSLKQLKNSLGRLKIQDSIICSVVPKAVKLLEKNLMSILGHKPHIIGKDITVPIKNLYRNPRQVGSDRLVNAYAGIMLYGLPRGETEGCPLILIDFGTAITFDVVSKNKEYMGGMILPGLSISLDALAQKTALLPKIRLEKPREFIGKDTKNSMLSGIVYGFSGLTDDLVKKLKDKIEKNAIVIGTGGSAGLIKKYSKEISKIDTNLTLKGLNLIFITQKINKGAVAKCHFSSS